jgi:hypothetical protein|nr:MAG TPA: hypothetical protein [Caudoviricetes sp.]
MLRKGVIKMKTYTYNALFDFLQRNLHLIDNIKCTSVKFLYFNDMEGWNYLIRFKIISKKGYKNKLIAIHTNSTYLDSLDTVNKDTVQSLVECYM